VRPFFLILTVSLYGCSAEGTLTSEERAKLDPPLQRLFSGGNPDESQFDVSTLSNGQKAYSVIIRSSNADELRSLGVQVGSVFQDVITARVTLKELRKILSLPAVRAVQTGSRNYPQ